MAKIVNRVQFWSDRFASDLLVLLILTKCTVTLYSSNDDRISQD